MRSTLTETNAEDPARPRLGRSVAGAVAPLADELQTAVDYVTNGLPKGMTITWLEEGSVRDTELSIDNTRRYAWTIVAVTLLEAIATDRPANFPRALAWFGDECLSGELAKITLEESRRAIERIRNCRGVSALYPYLLDTFGPTSRLDAMKDPSRKPKRSARKKLGSFYTPSDVADFMTSAIGENAHNLSWLDPACGSGVFLLSALKLAERSIATDEDVVSFATQRLFGIDISQQAADFAAFVVCHHLVRRNSTFSHRDIFVKIRRNIVATDALSISTRDASPTSSSLQSLFGPITTPLRVICNPPYISGGAQDDGLCESTLQTNDAHYLSFTRMSWTLASGFEDAAAFVVPLAIATSRTEAHRKFRSDLMKARGSWTALFFDRQPHALFGEDAKTRASIIIRRPGNECQIKTSRMLKWTSGQRSSIFSEERAHPMGSLPIGNFIPKLGCNEELKLYQRITGFRMISPNRPAYSSVLPSNISRVLSANDVLLGSTAYNYLNAFREYPDQTKSIGEFSGSKVHRLTFTNPQNAAAGFALMSSVTAYWLWHVECDGFHVPAWFLNELPFFEGKLLADSEAELANLGEQLWNEARANIASSNNGGKITFGFRPLARSVSRDKVDRLILASLGLGENVLSMLHKFQHETTSIDGKQRISTSKEHDKQILEALAG